MVSDTISLQESDIIRLIEAYFELRGLHLSMDVLERETGVINSRYPEEALVLRHFIVDGRWRDAVEYIRRLPLKEQDLKFMIFEIMKQKYVELICVYEELGNELYEDLGNAIALCFSELSTYSQCPVEHENLRNLASLSRLSQDDHYKDWNPISSRRKCFRTICSVLLKMQGLDEGFDEQVVDPSRLPSLLVKGILYESCEAYCQEKVNTQSQTAAFQLGCIINPPDSNTSDLNLYSWLQSVPWTTMTQEIVRRPLTIKVDKLDRPEMKDGWTEKILQNSTDLPEDVALEIRRPGSSSQGLKERFWNRRIENNLIGDASDILKRAEDVINRWEKRNSHLAEVSASTEQVTSKCDGTSRYGIGCVGDSSRMSKEVTCSAALESNVQKNIGSGMDEEHKLDSDTGSFSPSECDAEFGVKFRSNVGGLDSTEREINSECSKHEIGETLTNESRKQNFVTDPGHRIKVFDEKQNIRDLLEAKVESRNKLLLILRNTPENKELVAVTAVSNNFREADKTSDQNEMTMLTAPFFLRPYLVRGNDSNIKQIFAPSHVNTPSSNSSSPGISKKRKIQNVRERPITSSRQSVQYGQKGSPLKRGKQQNFCCT